MSVPAWLTSTIETLGRNPFLDYDPIRPLLAFHTSPHTRRMVRAPNQIGKTWSGAWESWAHLTGRHRYQPNVRPSSGMIMVADLDNTYPQVCEKLWRVAPRDLLDPATKYIPGKGFYTNGARFVRSAENHTIVFRPGEGSAMSAASATVGWI